MQDFTWMQFDIENSKDLLLIFPYTGNTQRNKVLAMYGKLQCYRERRTIIHAGKWKHAQQFAVAKDAHCFVVQ